MAALEKKLAEAVRQFPVLYEKSCRDFKDNSKKGLVWDDVAKQVGLQTGMYSSSENSFICSMLSLVRIMVLYDCSFHGFFRLSINSSYENKKQQQKQQSLVISQVHHLECLQMKARLMLKARLTILLPSCRFTLDQNFLPIPTLLPSLV